MGIRITRYSSEAGPGGWAVVEESEIYPLQQDYASLRELLTEGLDDVKRASADKQGALPLSDVKLLSPVTKPARIVCQGANYSTHRKEAGMQPERPPFNQIFSKSDTSLCGPTDDILRPSQVRLLDYEVEIGLVIGKPIVSGTDITEENFLEYVAGIVIANDVSARDVQLIEGQWFKGKSFRTFCPVGPYLYLFDESEAALVHNLELKLSVNGELRQSATTSQLLFKPEETLTELSGIVDFMPGDLVLTGTPGGVALHLSQDELAQLLDPAVTAQEKERLLLDSQSGRRAYLHDGDEVVCEVQTPDGHVHLGTQRNRVVGM